MLIEYRIKLEPDGITVTQRAESGSVPAGDSAGVSSESTLPASFPGSNGGAGNLSTRPGGAGNLSTRPGGAGNLSTGPGGAGNLSTGPGGAGNLSTGPGGAGNLNTGPGGSPPVIIFGPIIISGTNGSAYAASGQDISQFQMQPQQESNWCWAAVSVSVERYFVPQSTLTQCQVAGKLLGHNDCCLGSAACNQPAFLEDALADAGRPAVIKPPLAFADVRQQIDAGKPVCARIAWDGGTRGHFVVICGYQQLPTGEQLVEVADPFYAGSKVDFNEFATSYQGSGQWTDAYLV
jgi:hypothetical protein